MMWQLLCSEVTHPWSMFYTSTGVGEGGNMKLGRWFLNPLFFTFTTDQSDQWNQLVAEQGFLMVPGAALCRFSLPPCNKPCCTTLFNSFNSLFFCSSSGMKNCCPVLIKRPPSQYPHCGRHGLQACSSFLFGPN